MSIGRRCCVLPLILFALVAGAEAQQPSAQLAALLAKLPAETPAVRAELLILGVEDIRTLCAMLKEPGPGEDTQVRLALHGLAFALADPQRATERKTYIDALIAALRAAPPPADVPFVVEQLQLVAGTEACETLGRLLVPSATEGTCDAVARALQTIGGDPAVAALRAALPALSGRCRLSVIAALGALRDEASVAVLLADAKSDDRALRLAALDALAGIGDPRARDVLMPAAAADSWYERSRATDNLLVLAARLGAAKQADAAASILRELLKTRVDPADTHVRCAALHQLAAVCADGAVPDLLAALDDENPQVRAAAANAAAGVPGEAVTNALVAGFESASELARVALLEVFARRGDAAALPTVIKAFNDPIKEVRVAAFATAAALSGERAVAPLLTVFMRDDADELQAAHTALARIPGVEVTDKIITLMSNLPPRVRAHVLGVLAARPKPSTLEPIFNAAKDADAGVRLAAIRALAELADDASVPALLALLRGAETDDERTAAGEAIAAVCLRAADRARAAGLVAGVLRDAPVPVKCALLPALGRVGGKAALDATLAALGDTEPTVRESAIRAFAEWPDATPAPHVLKLVQTATDAKSQVLTLRAYVRMIGLGPERPAADTLAMCTAALAAAQRPEEKKLVLARLGEVKEPAALELLMPYLADEALRAEAASAMLNVVEALIPARCQDARGALDRISADQWPDALRERADAVRRRLERFEGYITDWWVAGPYTEKDKAGHQLLDMVLPPEEAGAKDVNWRKQPVNSDPESAWWIDLNATMAGDHRAAYAFTHVKSPSAQKLRLDLGSDDGVKVWLNGALVHTNNTHRGISPGEDKVVVTVNEGWNTLLIKVTNDDGGWALCARLRTPEGGNPPDVYAEAGDHP